MSSGQKYIIVNNEAGSAIVDAFADLASYIDLRNKDESGPLTAAASELTSTVESIENSSQLPADTQKYFEQIAKNSGALLSSPPAEFESALNLLWYVLSSAPQFESLIPVALEQLTSTLPTVHAQQIALLAVLGNLFNIIGSGSQQKPLVFAKIVDLAVAARATNQFVSQFPQLAEWLREWKYAGTEELVVKLVGAVQPRYEKEVIDFLRDIVVVLPELTEVARLLVSKSLHSNAPSFSLDALLTFPGVQNLKGKDDDLLGCLHAITEGDYAKFSQLSSKYTEDDVLVRQCQVAAISHLASSTTAGELKYADIAATLKIQDAEVEPIIVEAIKSGLIKGRMNQLSSTFAIEHATLVGPVTDQHWDTIESRLTNWKKTLSAILKVSDRTNKNRDLVKSLHKLEVN